MIWQKRALNWVQCKRYDKRNQHCPAWRRIRDEFIRDNYHKAPAMQIASIAGVCAGALSRIARRLGIQPKSRGGRRKYSKEE